MRRILSIPAFAACLLLCCVPAAGQSGGAAGSEAASAGEVARILRKIADGEKLDAGDIAQLDNAVIRIDEAGTRAGDPETAPAGMERKVYMLKVERGDANLAELAAMHKAMIQSQLTVLRVLALIARHQDRLERRVARTENIQRELIMGVRDMGRGVDMGRCDMASTNSDTIETNEACQRIADCIEKICSPTRQCQ